MSNVINLFGKDNKKAKKQDKGADNDYFEAVMKANQEKKDKLQKERQKHNKGVTKSYRLK